MCVLCGFKLRRSPGSSALLVDEMCLRRALAKGSKPDMKDFYKIQAHDLFHHGNPTDVVDLQVRDYAEQLKTFFLQVNGKDLRVWEGLLLVQSAARHNQIQKHMDAQKAAMKKKGQGRGAQTEKGGEGAGGSKGPDGAHQTRAGRATEAPGDQKARADGPEKPQTQNGATGL